MMMLPMRCASTMIVLKLDRSAAWRLLSRLQLLVLQEKRRAEELRKDAKRVEKIAEEEGVAVNADTADPSVLRDNTDDKGADEVDGAADEEDKKSDDGRRGDIDEADSAEEGEMPDEKEGEDERDAERDSRQVNYTNSCSWN